MYQLGIDFGTSFTKAAVYEVGSNKKPRPVPLSSGAKRGDYSIPTVAFVSSNGAITIGDDALNSKNNTNGKFYYNFKPELDTINEASFERRDLIRNIIVTFLREIKQKAEIYCKKHFNYEQTFEDVVITVPASSPKGGVRYYLMKRCAEIAGFNDVIIIPEPEAAAYCLLGDRVRSQEMNNKLFLIYDFGGGTFDTSIIKVYDEHIQVVDESVGSDNEQKWGGIYIDSLIGMDYVRKSDYAKGQVQILRDQNGTLAQRLDASDHLRDYPVRIKIYLSKEDKFVAPAKYSYTLTREEFELMIKGMVDNTIESTLSLLDRAHNDKLCDDIHSVYKVFLVGGTSQIPFVSSRWHFNKNALKANFSIDLNSDLNIIALGAARYRELRLSSQELIAKGKRYAEQGNYSDAAAYFNNAGDGEGLFYYGLLYYIGAIGRRRQPAKAYKLFKESEYMHASLMMALMKFNNDGVLKDDHEAKRLLSGLPDTTLKKSLLKVLEGGRNAEDFDVIYNFDAKTLFQIQ